VPLLIPQPPLRGNHLRTALLDYANDLIPVTPEQTAAWTRLERVTAYDWAMREHLAASDNLLRRRARPSFLPT
jgi:hypothetical protein